jgi:hypothetical protein
MWVAVQALRGLLAWCWIIGLLGLGRRFLNFSSKFLSHANEAVLPFYILHHTVIYIIGFYVIQWDMNVGSKFIVISVTSFAIIMAIYEVLIRHINLLRFLFGMKLIGLSKNSLILPGNNAVYNCRSSCGQEGVLYAKLQRI